MSDDIHGGRRLKITLVVRDEKDDPSILDVVRRAVEDGFRTPAIGTAPPTGGGSGEAPQRTTDTRMDELATDAREAAEKALAKVVEEFEASGKEPKFDPAQWAEQLSKVWDVIRRMKARGIELELPQADPIPPPDES